jgi:molybdate-binding protein/DNA-binding XRE family transcriptional regulator
MIPEHAANIMASSPRRFPAIAGRRHDNGWTQVELARRAGIPRTTLGAIEAGQLTPSVTAALALAAALDCTVEELFGEAHTHTSGTRGPEWAWQPRGMTCRYWQAEVGGQSRLYPIERPPLASIPHDGVWQDGAFHESSQSTPDPGTLVVACCDPAAGLLAAEYARASGFRLLVIERGGAQAIELLEAGAVHLAGIHRSTVSAPDLNSRTVLERLGKGHHLLRVADWEAGLVIAADEKSRSLRTIARRCQSWALREPGSAARECLEDLLASRSPAGRCVRGHQAVAEAVRDGWAEAGVCVRLCAEETGLNFLPIRTESLDLCVPDLHAKDRRVLALIHLLRSRPYRKLLSELPGYDVRHTGEIA